jgi:hypothetical protein
MKILTLKNNTIEYARATAYISKCGRRYYNVKHGSVGEDLWEYRMELDSRYYKDLTADSIILDSDMYVIKPVRDKNRTIVRDSLYNPIYTIAESSMCADRKGIILLASSPFGDNYVVTNFNTDESKNITLLAIGTFSIKHMYVDFAGFDVPFKIPAPVFEITDTATVYWTGNSDTNEEVTLAQTIHLHDDMLPTVETKYVTSKIRY